MRLKQEKGFTLLEVIIAISILTIGLLAVASMQVAALKGDSFAHTRTEATTWAQDRLELLMSMPYNQVVTLGAGAQPEGTYTVNWNVQNHPSVPNAIRITVWVDRNGRTITQFAANRSQLF